MNNHLVTVTVTVTMNGGVPAHGVERGDAPPQALERGNAPPINGDAPPQALERGDAPAHALERGAPTFPEPIEFDSSSLVYVSDVSVLAHFECPVCHAPLYRPLVLPCRGQHMFCKECARGVAGNARRMTCPVCRDIVNVADIASAPQPIRRTLNALIVRCPHHGAGCEWTGPLGDVEAHWRNACVLFPCGRVGCDFRGTLDARYAHFESCPTLARPCIYATNDDAPARPRCEYVGPFDTNHDCAAADWLARRQLSAALLPSVSTNPTRKRPRVESDGGDPDGVLVLSLRGTRYAVAWDELSGVPGINASVLGLMYHEPDDAAIRRDRDGTPFLDATPAVFEAMLTVLRGNVAGRVRAADLQGALDLLDYVGLLWPCTRRRGGDRSYIARAYGNDGFYGDDSWPYWRYAPMDEAQLLARMQLVRPPAGLYIGNADLRTVSFAGLSLVRAKFCDCEMAGVCMAFADLAGAWFVDCNMGDVMFESADLEAANFKRSSVMRATFKDANLRRTKFIDCVVGGADFDGATVDEETSFMDVAGSRFTVDEEGRGPIANTLTHGRLGHFAELDDYDGYEYVNAGAANA